MALSFSFVSKHAELTWKDIFWGYEHQMIGWKDIVDFAWERISNGSDHPLEIKLAGLQKSETFEIRELLQELAAPVQKESGYPPDSKWLYLNLLWVFENRSSFPDPLGEAEKIYADFDYPIEIQGFIRYMPALDNWDPGSHSKMENEKRLFKKWEEYLLNTSKRFKV